RWAAGIIFSSHGINVAYLLRADDKNTQCSGKSYLHVAISSYTTDMSYYAIDFGTSNSLLAHVSETGVITQVPLDPVSGTVLRSLLYTPEKNIWYFGTEAISNYVAEEGAGRFFRSIKKFLPEPGYTGTSVHNRNVNISELISVFLSEMKKRSDRFIGKKINKVVMGRPALYSLDKEHDQL